MPFPPQSFNLKRYSPAIKNSKQPYKSSGDWQPVYDINSIDYRCARNATISGERADVATIPAGSNVGTRPEFYFFAVRLSCLFYCPAFNFMKFPLIIMLE